MSDDTGYDFDGDVGLDPEDKKFTKSDRQEWFKGEKGHSYRAALVYFHPIDVRARKAAKGKKPDIAKGELDEIAAKVLAKKAEELGKAPDQLADWEKLDTRRVQFRRIPAHYKEGVGYVCSRLGLDGKEADKVWEAMGEQKIYYSTTLLLYPTNKDGEYIRERLSDGWTLKNFRFSNKVYTRLHQVAEGLSSNDLSIASQDISLKCTNTDFQNFDIDGAGKGLWLMNEKFRSLVLQKAVKLYKELNPFRIISTADLKDKLGMSGPAGTDVADDDFGDALAGV
jgi:hypothetical protein